MTDLSKQILEKAQGNLKLNPDEQRRYLGTFEERVLGYADIETASSKELQDGFLTIIDAFKNDSEPLFIKISPQLEMEQQLFYLKKSKEVDCQATIVSEDHNSSPFGLVIHSDAPVQTTEKDLRKAFSDLWQEKDTKAPTSLWKKWFG